MEPINKDDITVTKSYTEFPDDDPGIEYYIRHWSETPQTVEIRERVPESADIDAVDSHASGDLAWEQEGRELVFRHRIDTDGVTTAYTYTEELKTNLSEWMGEPDIEVIDGSEEAEAEASAESVTTNDKTAASDEPSTESTVDGESSGPNVAEIADAIEDMAGDGNIAVGDENSTTGDDDSSVSDEATATSDEDVAASDENSTASDEAVATSEETATSNDDSAASDEGGATGDEDDDEGIGNVGAALSTRFSEHDERIEELLDRADTHEAEIDALEATTATHTEEIDTLKNTTKDHGETITALTERTSQNETDIDDIADDIEGVADSLGELSDEIDDRFEAADEQRAALAARIDDHADQLSDLAGDIESVSEDVATLEARLDDDGDIGERIDDLEAEIDEFAQWREQIASTLMTVGSDDG